MSDRVSPRTPPAVEPSPVPGVQVRDPKATVRLATEHGMRTRQTFVTAKASNPGSGAANRPLPVEFFPMARGGAFHDVENDWGVGVLFRHPSAALKVKAALGCFKGQRADSPTCTGHGRLPFRVRRQCHRVAARVDELQRSGWRGLDNLQERPAALADELAAFEPVGRRLGHPYVRSLDRVVPTIRCDEGHKKVRRLTYVKRGLA